MNQILLHPSDILFFRDGRPMDGSLSGYGAAWPLPTVTDAALHAALHRSEILGQESHRHDQRQRRTRVRADVRLFGSLTHAGPFPVSPEGTWYFPRPLDLLSNSLSPSLQPYEKNAINSGFVSNLTSPAVYPVANCLPPRKSRPVPQWLALSTYEAYLHASDKTTELQGINDEDFSDTEYAVGIKIDPETGVTGQGAALSQIYSAQYLRLRDLGQEVGWRLGILAETREKTTSPGVRKDLIPSLFPTGAQRHGIIVGGQQRVCTATCTTVQRLPLPLGRKDDFQKLSNGRYAVKWVLLTPAIFPKIGAAQTQNGAEVPMHNGGWLPNWIAQSPRDYEGESIPPGQVMLLDGPGREKARRQHKDPGTRIKARLVAAIIPKPVAVTGWALPNQADPDRTLGGAKPTLLAVPAGAVYYFEADSPEAACKLAAALNWHGKTPGNEIRNRRSTLMGEKGFGLGVCGTWNFYQPPQSAPGSPSTASQ